jgi:hypothetical protein
MPYALRGSRRNTTGFFGSSPWWFSALHEGSKGHQKTVVIVLQILPRGPGGRQNPDRVAFIMVRR